MGTVRITDPKDASGKEKCGFSKCATRNRFTKVLELHDEEQKPTRSDHRSNKVIQNR
jgi:hypothetical protein